MDQVKQYLAVALRYGFWIGATVVLLGSLGIWFMTTSRLTKEADAQTGKIEADISQVAAVRGKLPSHPNPTSHTEMLKKIESREAEVLQAWSTVFDRQRGILTWPETELQPELIAEFKDKIPIEQFYVHPVAEADEIETTLRNNYAYYIGNALPAIAAIGNTEWTAVFDSSTRGAAGMEGYGMDMGMEGYGMPGPMMGPQDEGPLVKWSRSSQEAVLDDLFPWRGSRPTTLQIYYSQENMWILKSMLSIIASVNGDARQRFQAKIREIDKLAIGRSVKFGAGNISQPGSGMGGGMDGMGMGMDGMGMEDMYAGGMDSGMDTGMADMYAGGTGGVADVDPADNRYVDTLNQPITGAALRGALSSNSPTDANLAVAKRVPVMMRLKMDQRAVPLLIAQCGNAPLMIDVQQVRVLPKGSTGATEMGMESGYGSDMGMGMGMGADMGGMGSGYGAGMAAVTEPRDEFPLDMTVEVYGLMYFYNPPQEEKLGVEQITADTVIDGESMREGADAEEAVVVPQVIEAPADEALPAPNVDSATGTAPAADANVAPGTDPAVGVPPAAATPPAAPPPATPPPAGPPTAAIAPAVGSPVLAN